MSHSRYTPPHRQLPQTSLQQRSPLSPIWPSQALFTSAGRIHPTIASFLASNTASSCTSSPSAVFSASSPQPTRSSQTPSATALLTLPTGFVTTASRNPTELALLLEIGYCAFKIDKLATWERERAYMEESLKECLAFCEDMCIPGLRNTGQSDSPALSFPFTRHLQYTAALPLLYAALEKIQSQRRSLLLHLDSVVVQLIAHRHACLQFAEFNHGVAGEVQRAGVRYLAASKGLLAEVQRRLVTRIDCVLSGRDPSLEDAKEWSSVISECRRQGETTEDEGDVLDAPTHVSDTVVLGRHLKRKWADQRQSMDAENDTACDEADRESGDQDVAHPKKHAKTGLDAAAEGMDDNSDDRNGSDISEEEDPDTTRLSSAKRLKTTHVSESVVQFDVSADSTSTPQQTTNAQQPNAGSTSKLSLSSGSGSSHSPAIFAEDHLRPRMARSQSNIEQRVSPREKSDDMQPAQSRGRAPFTQQPRFRRAYTTGHSYVITSTPLDEVQQGDQSRRLTQDSTTTNEDDDYAIQLELPSLSGLPPASGESIESHNPPSAPETAKNNETTERASDGSTIHLSQESVSQKTHEDDEPASGKAHPNESEVDGEGADAYLSQPTPLGHVDSLSDVPWSSSAYEHLHSGAATDSGSRETLNGGEYPESLQLAHVDTDDEGSGDEQGSDAKSDHSVVEMDRKVFSSEKLSCLEEEALSAEAGKDAELEGAEAEESPSGVDGGPGRRTDANDDDSAIPFEEPQGNQQSLSVLANPVRADLMQPQPHPLLLRRAQSDIPPSSHSASFATQHHPHIPNYITQAVSNASNISELRNTPTTTTTNMWSHFDVTVPRTSTSVVSAPASPRRRRISTSAPPVVAVDDAMDETTTTFFTATSLAEASLPSLADVSLVLSLSSVSSSTSASASLKPLALAMAMASGMHDGAAADADVDMQMHNSMNAGGGTGSGLSASQETDVAVG
ncbi:uncharacterized protein EV422DRAFT_539459 [Fimicolochytrium jonesii]|uniref:uncharacterized protein n=1 Tax=Fimicolochytrium jonesii TaxID=1396493 RepID=UPI0022FE28C7|nr:uncharacterized protein EV422DRAFT_539459 [Fimicolochytrium jonesii]KAI8817964.1 hypothetical protein EV422DRAFT_539459 [Fimicolochytrium jonesii]